MPEPLADQVRKKIQEAALLYHRLVLVVGPEGSGKTHILQEITRSESYPLINVNLELSRRMLDLTIRQRSLDAPKFLAQILAESKEEVVLLDNLEILFDAQLKLDPLRLLQGLSRNKTIVASWNGRVHNGHLTYATPDHPEYRSFSTQDLLILMAEKTS